MCKNNNVVAVELNVDQCMLDFWVSYERDNMLIITRPLVALVLDAYTQQMVAAYCAIDGKAVDELQDIINQIDNGMHPEVTKLVTRIDFSECGDAVVVNTLEQSEGYKKGKIERYWRSLKALLDTQYSMGQTVEVDEFLEKLTSALKEVKRNGS